MPKAAVDKDDKTGTHEDEVGMRTLDWSTASPAAEACDPHLVG
jgi:hypothetical protein